MKKLTLTAMIAATLMGVASPAMAQPMGTQPMGRHNDAWALTPARNNQIRSDINGLSRAIDRAQARRTISPREAQGLRRDANNVRNLYARYARGGLDRQEVRDLQGRVNGVRQQLRLERRDWDGQRG
jgi:hypothetical protein